MHVFIALQSHELEIMGVFATLEEALAVASEVDEYIMGSTDRIRSYDTNGKIWWENGKDVRFA